MEKVKGMVTMETKAGMDSWTPNMDHGLTDFSSAQAIQVLQNTYP